MLVMSCNPVRAGGAHLASSGVHRRDARDARDRSDCQPSWTVPEPNTLSPRKLAVPASEGRGDTVSPPPSGVVSARTGRLWKDDGWIGGSCLRRPGLLRADMASSEALAGEAMTAPPPWPVRGSAGNEALEGLTRTGDRSDVYVNEVSLPSTDVVCWTS